MREKREQHTPFVSQHVLLQHMTHSAINRKSKEEETQSKTPFDADSTPTQSLTVSGGNTVKVAERGSKHNAGEVLEAFALGSKLRTHENG